MPAKTLSSYGLHIQARTKLGEDAEPTQAVVDDVVQAAFARADDDTSGFTIGVEDDHISFKIASTLDSKTVKGMKLMLQKPVVSVEGEDVVAKAVNRGKSLVKAVPAEPGFTSFAVQFECLAETVAPVKVVLRFLEMKKGTKSIKEIPLTFFKACSGADKAVKGTFFEGLFVGLQPTAKDIVQDGEAASNWAVTGDDDKSRTTIPDHMMKTTFFVSYDGAEGIMLDEPFIIIEDPKVLAIQTFGPLENGDYNVSKDAVPLTLQYTCLQSGTTAVTVGLKADDQPDLTIIWAFEKVCSQMEAVEGVSIAGLNLGTEHGLSDMIVDGITTSDFRNAFNQIEENTKQLTQYGADMDSVTFYLTAASTVELRQPVMTIARTLSQDFLHVANPAVSGPVTRSNKISKGQELSLTLTFNCVRTGQSDISVEIPIKPKGSLQFVVQKSCVVAADQVQDTSSIKNLAPIPGLNMGTARGAANVIRDGIPQSKWHWETKVIDLHMVLPTTPFLTLFLTKNASKTAAPDVRIGSPELISTLAVSHPDISGRASDGDIVTVDSHSSITITFHCFQQGTTLFNLEVPLLPMAIDEMAPRPEPIKISFLKECTTDPQEIITGAGGVGITGLNIGTTQEGNDIVYNGFPRPSYYGQRHRDEPQWDEITVPADQKSTRIYFTFGSKFSGAVEPLEEVTFQPPLAVTHGHECKPTLSGPGANGGVLSKNGDGLEMDITWNCRYKGRGSVSVAIHILPHGKITITIPKECEGLDKPEGILVPGFTVGLTSTGHEAINNGLTTPEFLPYKPHQAPNHIEEGLSTIFYVSSPSGAVGAIEPVVFCARPIANPRVIHNMHIGNDDSEKDWEDAVEIVIPEQPQTMEIDYNCVGIGSTPITVVIPILPKGSQVAFTWTLTCGGSSFYEFYSYEYMDSYYDMGTDMYTDYYADSYGKYYDDEEGTTDWYYYTDDYYLLGSYSSSAYMYSESRASDEFLWSELPSTDFLYDLDRGLGWINVGTGPNVDDSDDVVSFGQALESYALIPGAIDANGEGDEIENTVYTVVSRQKETSKFYLSVPLGHETFAPPEVYARQGSKGADICAPSILGAASVGGDLTAETDAIELEIEYNCVRPGVTPISVKIPLGTNYLRSVNFRVIKVCRNFKPKVEWYWTASRIMFLGTMVVGFFLGIFAYRTLKNTKERTHQLLPTKAIIDDLDDLDSDSD